jgi:hypothetical protein
MKSNFKKNEDIELKIDEESNFKDKELTQKEFEEYIAKSGAKGSFMIYRSDNKEEELGLDEL